MTDKELFKLALDALEYIDDGANNQGAHTGISWRCVSTKAEPVITALKERLLEDPMREVQRLGQEIEQEPFGIWHQGATDEESDFYLYSESGDVSCPTCIKLYTAPPQRTEALIGCVNHDCDKCKPHTA